MIDLQGLTNEKVLLLEGNYTFNSLEKLFVPHYKQLQT